MTTLRMATITVGATIALLLFFAGPATAATSFGGNHGVPGCVEAGCLYGANGVAVDPMTGDVYVAELFDNRVSKFSPSGEFLLMFGRGVDQGPHHPGDICTKQNLNEGDTCGGGMGGSSAGEFDIPQAVVVDSAGGVYVADFGNHRVEEFDSKGEFVLMFGGGVDQGPHHPGDICTKENLNEGDTCGAGTVGNGPGQIGEWGYTANNIAIGGPEAEAEVYVGDEGRVDVFKPSGAFMEQISLAALSSTARVGALAVDPLGDIFFQLGAAGDGGRLEPGAVPGVHEFEPNGTEKATQFDPGGWASSLAMNGSDLYAADPEGGLKILGYHTSSGQQFQSFEPEIGPSALGMAFSGATRQLYISGENSLVLIVPAPPPGPLVKPGSESATPEPRGSATLRATVDPEGNATTCRFEYVLAAQYDPSAANPYAAGASVQCEPADLGEGFSNVSVVAHLKGLAPAATYRWRVVATNVVREATGEDQKFEEIPPALVDGPWSSEVSSTAAVLAARIDPLGVDTSYRLEYGTSTAYEHIVSGDVGAGEAYVSVSAPLTGLQPHTVYHYRLVTISTTGTVEIRDRTFRTQLAAASVVLPDERAWEQVSPPEKHGGSIISEEGFDVWQAAPNGDGVAYVATAPVSEEPHTSGTRVSVLSTRGEGGWRSLEPMPTKSLPPEGSEEASANLVNGEFPPFYSVGLSHALIEPSPFVKGLSPEVSEFTLYLYDAATGAYRPLVTPADVETGAQFIKPFVGEEWMSFRGATPDLSHVVFVSPLPLTKEALEPPDLPICAKDQPCNGEENLYEWVAGRLHLVNILPEAEGKKPTVAVFLGRGLPGRYGAHAVSNDGRWIVWTHQVVESERPALYVRDMVGEETFRVGGKEAVYETMSGDGSRVFYLEGDDLHEFDTTTRTQTDLTAAHGPGEPNAGVQDAILGSSEDGTYVYIVAHGVLTGAQQNAAGETAIAGEPNVYELHDSGSVWGITYIATLSTQDERDWFAPRFAASEATKIRLEGVTSHVSPDGHLLAFMSERSLTGYDNVDVKSGARDEEVFLFDAQAQRLVCISCNPTGARPRAIFDSGFPTSLGVDPENAWTGHWLAGSMPGWRPFLTEYPMYEPRVLLDSGRLFFQSPDALVPQDTNGQEDVYEYEPPGAGTCTERSPTFSPASAGCVSLISSGVSSQESVFFDASQSGNDVFFSTNARLAWTDVDEAFDVYDARAPHVSGERVGFPEPPRPPQCEGDACQGAPPTVIDQTPSSLTFVGPGNQPPKTASQAPKSTRHSRCRKGRVSRHGRCVKVRKRTAGKGRRAHHKRGGRK
jgi:hypothetical protein